MITRMKKWFIESYFSTAQYQQKGDLKMNSKSIFATATITNKSENQDSKGQISTNLLNAVLVADGLGSYKYARQASDSVVGSLLKTLGSIKDNSRLDFEKLFKTAKDELIKLSDKTKTDEEKKGTDSLFGTTLLTIVETKHTVKIAYVGNGAIWHIRGNFADNFHKTFIEGHQPISITWNVVNLLNPHSIPENGKEALLRLISECPTDYAECVPTVIEIKKDSQEGDIFMICSDGIYSADKPTIFPSKSGKIFIRYEETMQKFFEHLKLFFEKNSEYTNENLSTAINLYLQEVKPDLDDDATLGVLITEKALNYQKSKKTNNCK